MHGAKVSVLFPSTRGGDLITRQGGDSAAQSTRPFLKESMDSVWDSSELIKALPHSGFFLILWELS